MNITASTITLFAMIAFSIWGKGIFRIMSILLGLIIGFIVSWPARLITNTALQQWSTTSFFSWPDISHLHYHFAYQIIVPFTIAGIASALRSIGSLTTVQMITHSNWTAPDRKLLKRGVLADGIGCMIAGLLGCSGISTAPTLIGMSKITGVASRYVAFVTAAFLLLLAFLPKILAIFTLIPLSILGAALVFNGAFMIIAGMQIILIKPITIRATLVIGISYLSGASYLIFPNYYAQLPSYINIFTSSVLSIAAISAIILTLFFRINIRKCITIKSGSELVSFNSFGPFIQNKVSSWYIPKAVLNRAESACEYIIEQLIAIGTPEKNITIEFDFDQVDLNVTFHYQWQCA